MPRWEPQARDRLRDAALELFLAHGFDNVTVAQITERAGLTRRTFSRYFTDKRDVLFAGSEQLPAVLAAAVGRADPDLAPFTALLTALTEVGDLVADEHAAERRAIVQASPELQERGLTKFAAVTSALAAALEQRGAEAATAALLAPVGTAIFRAAFDRWAEQPDRGSLADRIRETAAELAASMQPAAPPPRRAATAADQQPGGRPDAAEPRFSEMAKRIAELNDTQTCAGHGSLSRALAAARSGTPGLGSVTGGTGARSGAMLTETARLRARYGLCGAWPAGYGAQVTSCRSCR